MHYRVTYTDGFVATYSDHFQVAHKVGLEYVNNGRTVESVEVVDD